MRRAPSVLLRVLIDRRAAGVCARQDLLPPDGIALHAAFAVLVGVVGERTLVVAVRDTLR